MLKSKTRRLSTTKQLSTSTSIHGNIRVVVRVRPPNKRELNYKQHRNIIHIVDDQTLIFDPKEEDAPFFYQGVKQNYRDISKRTNRNCNFTFDNIFGFDSTNDDVFQRTTKDLIESLMDGYNCSVFAYGATGAGKTHTMLGRDTDYGITLLTMSELFHHRDKLSADREFNIDATYLEVYNETIKDLLDPGSPLKLCENKEYGVIVNGLKVFHIEELQELFVLLGQGNSNRTQHVTDANAESSRSHAIFQVYITMKFKSSKEVRFSKLSMIDLAGSEKGAATGYSGARFKEGTSINKSLLSLSNCINSLATGKKYVSYRDSKLTRLLKDSLGGNCQTIMLANLSPSSLNYEDTYNTLKYAMRATKIKLNLKKSLVAGGEPTRGGNNVNYMKLVEDLNNENKELKEKLLQFEREHRQLENKENIAPLLPLQDKYHLELESLYLDKQKVAAEVNKLESAEQLLKLKQQLKSESTNAMNIINKKSDNLPNLELQELETQVKKIRDKLTTLRERSKGVESKLQNLLKQAPHLQSIVKHKNLEIECAIATIKVEHFKKVGVLQAENSQRLNQFMEQFSEMVKSLKNNELQKKALVTTPKAVEQRLARKDRLARIGSADKNLLRPPHESKIKYKKLEESPLNSTFLLSSSSGSKSKLVTTIQTTTPLKTISFAKNILQSIPNSHRAGKVLKPTTKKVFKINSTLASMDSPKKKISYTETYRSLVSPKFTPKRNLIRNNIIRSSK